MVVPPAPADLPRQLLELSHRLMTSEEPRSREASFRRAVSTAYYAAFHLLTTQAARQLAPEQPSGLRLRVGRAFSHAEMLKVCTAIADPNLYKRDSPISRLLTFDHGELQPELVLVANNFVRLQGARHAADYNLSHSADADWASGAITWARECFDAWERIRTTANAGVFLAALACQSRWSTPQ